MTTHQFSDQNDYSCCAPELLFPDLQICVYRFTVKMKTSGELTGNLGSAWRGLLGWALRDKCCPWDECLPFRCASQSNCPWHMFYVETPNIPKPFVLMPYNHDATNPYLDLTLIGLATKMVVDIAEALDYGGRTYGLNCHGKKSFFSLQSIERFQSNRSWVPFYEGTSNPVETLLQWLTPSGPTPDKFSLIAASKSPLRLRKDDCYLHSKTDWSFAFKSLANRCSKLNKINAGSKIDTQTWEQTKRLFDNPGEIRLINGGQQDWVRASSTQNKPIHMGGRVDSVIISPPQETAKAWLAWWQTAELLHLGKGTTMGNGKIELFIV